MRVHDEGPVLVGDQAGVLGAEHVGQRRLRPRRVADPVRQTVALAAAAVDVVVVVGLMAREEGPTHRHRVRHRVRRLLPHQAAQFLQKERKCVLMICFV